jgi:hypothetical protein
MKTALAHNLINRLILALLTILLFSIVEVKASLTNPNVALSGVVKDKEAKNLALQIQLVDKDGNIIARTKSNTIDGKFYFSGLKADSKYTLKVLNKGKELEVVNIITPQTLTFKEMNVEVKLTKDITLN